jgi:hypothetical protein
MLPGIPVLHGRGSTPSGFVLGTICAFVLAYAGGAFSIRTFNSLWWSHAEMMNVATGLTVLAAGWAVGIGTLALGGRRSPIQFPFAVGLIGGTTFLAVFMFGLAG